MSAPRLLEVEDLKVEFDTYGGVVQAVRGVSFGVDEGRTLAIVGESGCGKSVTVQSIMGLTPMPPGRITSGSARLRGTDIIGRKEIGGDLAVSPQLRAPHIIFLHDVAFPWSPFLNRFILCSSRAT